MTCAVFLDAFGTAPNFIFFNYSKLVWNHLAVVKGLAAVQTFHALLIQK